MNPIENKPPLSEPAPTSQIAIVNIAAFQQVGRPIVRFLMIPLLLFSLPFMLFGGFFMITMLSGSMTRTQSTEGTVSTITASSSRDSDTGAITTTCTYSYRFTSEAKTYTGTNSIGSTDNCARHEGDTVGVVYNPTKPTDNGADEPFSWLIGLLFFIPGLIMFVVALSGFVILRNREKSPATQAQQALIESGFQELGEFWTPHTMTQREARELMIDINRRIELQKTK